jgi:hypothetical protein
MPLVRLYNLQPWQVLSDHLQHLRSLELQSEQEIEWYRMELRKREDGVENVQEALDDFRKLVGLRDFVEDAPDEVLRDAIDARGDKLLTISSHYAAIAAVGEVRAARESWQ